MVFEGTGDAATDFVLGVSASDGEDVGSRAGWEIEDGRRFGGSAASAGTNYQVSVNGTAIPTEVPANWDLVPAGLGMGDTFRLLFLSSGRRDGASPAIEDYNAFVQNRAAAGHAEIREYGAGFRVVGCTEATDARDNTRTIHTTSDQGVPIYWLGGNKLADDYGDFYDGDWDDEANPKNELGANWHDTSSQVYLPLTGCDHDGTESFDGTTSQALGLLKVRAGISNSNTPGNGPISGDELSFPGTTRPMYGLSELFWVTTAAATVPGAPTGLTATADGETGIDLSWTAPADDGGSDITGYRIEVSADGGSAWADLVADTGSMDTIHSHTGLSAGSTRHYRVSAINDAGTGLPSGVAYTTTTAAADLLVSNTGQTGDPGVIEAIGDQDGTHSQGFETGSNPGGYGLASVGVYVADADLGAGEAFTVHIHAADGAGGLGAVAYTLTSPGVYTANAVNVFTAPVGAALDADTAYHVVFEGTGDAATDFALGVTASDGEDVGSRLGWEIEDGRRFQGSVASAGTNFQVSVNGTAVTEVYPTWGLVPAGLSAGDTFRLLFLSSTKRNARSSDIEVYNAFVQNRAAAGHADIREYSAGFRVVGCTAATDARDNTRTTGQGVPIYWLVGNRLADDYGDFYDGSWDDQANDKDESGANGPDTSFAANYPFTGCDDDGTEEVTSGGSRALGNSSVRVAQPGLSGPISSPLLTSSSNTRPMYGLSELFRVSAATAPGAPTGLTATADGETGIGLSWTAPADDGDEAITGYRIEVSADGGNSWTDLVANTNSTGTIQSHTSLSAGSTRHYRVSAINAVGTGLPSGVAYATTAAADLLVGNTGQSGDPDVTEAIGDQDGTHSQGFETGSNPGGTACRRWGCTWWMRTWGQGETFTVHIHAADGAGGLGAVAYTLTSPGVYTANAVNVFTAPAGAALEADTAYHVVFEGTGDAATDFVLGVSASDGEDVGSRAGWNIEDGRRFGGGVAVAGTSYGISVNGSRHPDRGAGQLGPDPGGAGHGGHLPAAVPVVDEAQRHVVGH